MKNSKLKLAIAAAVSSLASFTLDDLFPQTAPRRRQHQQSERSKHDTKRGPGRWGQEIGQRELRRRFHLQDGNPRGRYAVIAGKVRNRKKLLSGAR